MMVLSDEQLDIINLEGNVVVIANPGSGKTTTLAYKIARVFSFLKPWKGIIAISYTNKASNELRDKIVSLALDNGNSFFGTIDSFYLSEIIYPFFKSMYEINTTIFADIEIVNKEKVTEYNLDNISKKEKMNMLISLLNKGKLVLEYISDIALFILKKSADCRNYLKARYEYICIDEYQDCNEKKHEMFLFLVEMGIIGVAVGDPNQSIFGFAGSNSEYLLSLTERADFSTKPLTLNRRSHKQIVDYSLKFLDKKYAVSVPAETEKRIHLRKILGKEEQIAKWIDDNIETIMKVYKVANFSDVGILVLNGKTTAKVISKNLKHPSKYIMTTPLDESSLYTDLMFKNSMMYVFGHRNIYIEEYLEKQFAEINKKESESFVNYIKQERKNHINGKEVNLNSLLGKFKSLFKREINDENIRIVLSDESLYSTYKPLDSNEISILTTHKSKGLEFKIVFILDHYKFILPKHDFVNKRFESINNDKNVHYVAITRAKEAVFFLLGSKRINSSGEEKDGIVSEFLDEDNNEWGSLSLLRTNK